MRRHFPFSALVGQELLKKGLLVTRGPGHRGVLLRGRRVREDDGGALVRAVLPPKTWCRGAFLLCRGRCCATSAGAEASGSLRYDSRPVEVVDLALNASEDRVVEPGPGGGASGGEPEVRDGFLEGERERVVHR